MLLFVHVDWLRSMQNRPSLTLACVRKPSGLALASWSSLCYRHGLMTLT